MTATLPDQPALIPLRGRHLALWAAGLALLLVATCIIYIPGLDNGLVWDDRPNIVENEHVRGITGEGLAWAFTESHVGHYQPFTWVSFMLDYTIWAGNPRGYHLTNLALHGLNGAAFSLLAMMLLGLALPGAARDRPMALVAGALIATGVFLLHPLRVESVAWATQRRDVLCGVFFLTSMICYVRAVRDPALLRPAWYWAAVALFALSLLSKALGMALPVVLLVMDAYPLRRDFSVARTRRRIILEKIPFFVLALASAGLAIAAQSETGATASLESHDWLQRAAQACFGIIFYIRAHAEVAWYPLYELPMPLDVTEWRFVASAVLVVAITALVLWMRRAWPAATAAWVCFVALLAPVLGFAQSGSQLVADRYTYLSGLVIALLLGGLAVRAWRTWPIVGPWAVAAAAIAVGVIWTTLSARQVGVWQNEETLWTHVVRGGPSSLAENNLGVLAAQRGDRDRAAAHFTQSLEIAPRYARARQNLVAQLSGNASRLDERVMAGAVDALRGSLDVVAEGDGEAWYALGAASLRLGRPSDAVHDFRRAVELMPTDVMAWAGLSLALDAVGNRSAALEAAQQAVKIDPSHPSAQAVLEQMQRP